jgi:hypothetical protein
MNALFLVSMIVEAIFGFGFLIAPGALMRQPRRDRNSLCPLVWFGDSQFSRSVVVCAQIYQR